MESQKMLPFIPRYTVHFELDFCIMKLRIRSRSRLGREGILSTEVMHLEVPHT